MSAPTLQRSRVVMAGVGVAALATLVLAGPLVFAQEKTTVGQTLLKVDWADPEITAFTRSGGTAAGPDRAQLNAVMLPVLAFGDTPQIVKNIAGPDAKPIKPRSIITDPKQPYWYHLVDTYDGVTVAINADRRINHQVAANFQIGAAKNGAAATLSDPRKPRISIFDGSTEEGMEGVILEYTIQKFPDIPYTVTIECAAKAKSQCKDLTVITKDEALLRIISAGKS